MFDLDEFVQDCRRAVHEATPAVAVKELLTRAVSDPGAVASVLPPTKAEIARIHVDDELSIFKVVWAPRMSIFPHNHLMWAAIGLYAGQEDNALYRRARGGLDRSGGIELREGEAAVFGRETIHSVTNPRAVPTAAIHVYGGNLPAQAGRSEWNLETSEELAYDFRRTERYFEDANR